MSARRLVTILVAAAALPAACGEGPLDAVIADPASLTVGLVAHWTFDEGAGTVVGDHSGNGHDGTMTGGTWTSAGRFGGALTLATGDYVTVNDFPQGTANWTVSVWTYTNEAQLIADMTDGETIISTENVFAGGWQIHLDNRPGYERFDAAYWAGTDVNDYVVVYCDCIAANRWIHLTAVWDNDAKRFTLYEDARVVDRMSLPIPLLPGDPTLLMGTWNMKNRYLAATIDDFAIWNRALRPGEIALLSRDTPTQYSEP